MALNFSAEQYESGYKPAHLSQWEVPKKVREYPRRREGYTIPITDDNGRFLPGVTKLIFKEWSPYEPTWEKDYPRPGSALGTPIEPGYWMIKGRHARWVEAQSIGSNNSFEAI